MKPGKVKERAGRGKTNSLFVCFRPPCAHPLGDKDNSFNYESKSSRMVKPRATRDHGKVSIDVGDGKGSSPAGGGDGGDKEKDIMAGKPWSTGRPVLAYIALHPGGHNYVIQTPAEILATPTGRRKMVHAAFAKVFNAMSFRNSTQSTKDINPRVRDRSVPRRSKEEPRATPSSSTNSSATTDNSSIASSSLGSSSTRSIASWSESAGDQQAEPNASTIRTSKSKRYCRYDYLSCVSLPSLALCLLMLSSLSMMMLMGKLCAIIWTTSWLYMVAPPRRSDSHHEHINKGRRRAAETVGKAVLQMQGSLERSRSRA